LAVIFLVVIFLEIQVLAAIVVATKGKLLALNTAPSQKRLPLKPLAFKTAPTQSGSH
jgi:hypothetical protein